jgi:hypothetical protein
MQGWQVSLLLGKNDSFYPVSPDTEEILYKDNKK